MAWIRARHDAESRGGGPGADFTVAYGSNLAMWVPAGPAAEYA
jgi:hypothetical protein